ncbi:DUF2442 domain-containing protein [Sedimentisphaera salicampi]|uniref:DUF2442 domain-containing protein n=1 Tax=Sedimentisphaera salicampi TaxID=1941349 RepID=A0A1W6LKC9_9BACT|nr:DUF2442 domain-containing protein [Sedimentisphaera salicampi]ARN56202.1 hypothetical protein STSP1_00576 [Sedimentisphaera salicampi]OXU15676.1 hypothetical protein SMSP1_00573 [Sedimentisphaera salicampi]
MYKGVIEVKPLEDFKLDLKFENGERRVFDLSRYLNKGKFAELKNMQMFNSARVAFDSVEWANGIDIDPETLYNESKCF